MESLVKPLLCIAGTSILLGIVFIVIVAVDCKRNHLHIKRKHSSSSIMLESVAVALFVIGVCFALFVCGSGEKTNGIAATFIGAILGWIFKDYIIGIFVFIHLYIRGFLRKGNWIVLPERNIDGEVEEMSLLSTVVKNWDNTRTVVPTYMLHENAFTNWQDVADGQTTGRRMLYTFHIDVSSIHPMSDADQSLNLTAFRNYVQSYMASHTKLVSLSAPLMVRVLESNGEGVPLQIYAYLSAVSNKDFSDAQSKIVEDLLAQMPKYGLSLFQAPSAAAVNQIQLVKEK